MSVKLKISVTKEILEKSHNCSETQVAMNCAIALAVRDIFPDACVGPIGIRPFSNQIAITLPKNARQFIGQFDSSTPEERMEMSPITFEIEVPDEVIELINIDELKPLLQNHPTLELLEV